MTPQMRAWLTDLRHDLHQNPEVSGEEIKTAARIAELLRHFSPTKVLTEIGGHGVAAVYDSGNSGPGVGIRCELDALPIQEMSDAPYSSSISGKGHLCGHDGHMAMVFGVADAISKNRPANGKVILIFQPAEETGKGALAFCTDPRFAELSLDYIFSLHNLPGLDLGTVELCNSAANCASRGMRISFFGKTSHAAAPQDGVSPANAMSRLMPALVALGSDKAMNDDYALATLTHAELGERTFGVAPGHGELWVTLRTVTDQRMKRLVQDAELLVHREAEAEGLAVTICYDDIFEACTNQEQAVEYLARACRASKVPIQRTDQPQRFSEDFGQFGKCAKTAMLWLGAGTNHPKLHNPDYDFPDALIP
ncbi:MAG: amidohydrolase, partial [Ruegeria sp.]